MEQKIEAFEQFGLSQPILQAVIDSGYEIPTPIQEKTIPLMLSGKDLMGQAQTGTGKTAAFALPILEKLDINRREVQALILTPTRELAIQVAEAFHNYSKHLGTVRVLPIYGGASIQVQLARLKSGVQIVVGTPGRVMDHLRRETLSFDALTMVVLDEADEMLRMGFIEDVEWILGQASGNLQIALFSATIPGEIRRIADRYLKEPVTVEIEHKTLTVPTIEQQYILLNEGQKVDALSQVLETQIEPGEAALIFASTKGGTDDLAEKLLARGFEAESMNGDLSQAQRENVIRRLRSGDLNVVVATDVAARGLDVDHIAMVINYDIPYDTESYVHRIGRTGRAGRAGRAMLFVTPRQKRMLREIERYTGQRITPAKIPSLADVAARRIAQFKETIIHTLEQNDLDFYLNLVEEIAEESGKDIAEIAAAASRLARGDRPLDVAVGYIPEPEEEEEERGFRDHSMVRLYIDAGRKSGIRPADVVGAIANEGGLPGNVIGAIDIGEYFTLVDIPAQYVGQVLKRMAKSTIRTREMKIRPASQKDIAAAGTHHEFPKFKGKRIQSKPRKKLHKKKD